MTDPLSWFAEDLLSPMEERALELEAVLESNRCNQREPVSAICSLTFSMV